ncbi:hypothetical protein CLAIMM_02181 isoform 3 [Cladophialophora immunda]|nr:hypothetical protein CLAIMM_02181 isoform 3 [Cladophialophora immunda]
MGMLPATGELFPAVSPSVVTVSQWWVQGLILPGFLLLLACVALQQLPLSQPFQWQKTQCHLSWLSVAIHHSFHAPSKLNTVARDRRKPWVGKSGTGFCPHAAGALRKRSRRLANGGYAQPKPSLGDGGTSRGLERVDPNGVSSQEPSPSLRYPTTSTCPRTPVGPEAFSLIRDPGTSTVDN